MVYVIDSVKDRFQGKSTNLIKEIKTVYFYFNFWDKKYRIFVSKFRSQLYVLIFFSLPHSLKFIFAHNKTYYSCTNTPQSTFTYKQSIHTHVMYKVMY